MELQPGGEIKVLKGKKLACSKNVQIVRIIDNAKTASHTDPFFFKYKILKLNDLNQFNQATFMYKYMKNLLPSLYSNTFKKLGNFERSLNYQISLEYLPFYAR